MAQDMFLKLKGIKGECRDKVYKDEIDVLAYSWGASNAATMAVGGGGGAGRVNIQDMSITKWMDKSSTNLMLHCCQGKHIAEAELIVRKSGGTPVEYLTISMQEVMISSISSGASGGEDRMTENISLNFAKVAVKYIEQKADGGEGEKPDMAWNIEENTDMAHFKMG